MDNNLHFDFFPSPINFLLWQAKSPFYRWKKSPQSSGAHSKQEIISEQALKRLKQNKKLNTLRSIGLSINRIGRGEEGETFV
jgi:hypothetical protein